MKAHNYTLFMQIGKLRLKDWPKCSPELLAVIRERIDEKEATLRGFAIEHDIDLGVMTNLIQGKVKHINVTALMLCELLDIDANEYVS